MLNMPNMLPLDAQLMGAVRVGLNIPYKNLYKVASSYGRFIITSVETFVRGRSIASVLQPLIKATLRSVQEVWGTNGFGTCYKKWQSDKDMAKYLHYYYKGPDINPYGVYSNCSVIRNVC